MIDFIIFITRKSTSYALHHIPTKNFWQNMSIEIPIQLSVSFLENESVDKSIFFLIFRDRRQISLLILSEFKQIT